MMDKITSCPLTSLNAKTNNQNEVFIEYTITVNGYTPRIRLSKQDKTFWNSDQVDKYKFLNHTLFYNKEWPVDEDIIITKHLIEQIFRRHQFPKLDNTEEKMEYLLEKIYREGGKSLDTVTLPTAHYPYAFVENYGKLKKIVERLKTEGLIEGTFKKTSSNGGGVYKIDLTPKGEQKAKQIQKEKRNNRITPKPNQRPNLLLIYDEKDNEFVKIVENSFKNSYKGSRNVSFGSDHTSTSYTIDSLAKQLDDPSYFVIFIISENGRNNSSISAALKLCHSYKRNNGQEFLYFAFVDDVDYRKFVVVGDFHMNNHDLRYNPDRIYLHNKVVRAYQNVLASKPSEKTIQPGNKYSFPVFALTEQEKFWLEKVYEKFLSNEDFEVSHLLATLWDNVPNFEPARMNNLLIIAGKEITLLGIWHVAPESDIFQKVDLVFKGIGDYLRKNGSIDPLTPQILSKVFPQIPVDEMRRIIILLSQFSGFWSSRSIQPGTNEYTINIAGENVYRKYLNYSDLETLMREYVAKLQGNTDSESRSINTDETQNILSTSISDDAFPHERKNILVQDPQEISGILNVEEIANETWSLLREMPGEKGIFGIFGRWGRGKSFLIKKVIERIEDDNINSTKKYIIVEFDAWKYQDTPAAWAYLYQTLAEKYTFLSQKIEIFGWNILNKGVWSLNFKKYKKWPFFLSILSIFVPVTFSFFSFQNKIAVLVGLYSLFGIGGLYFIYRLYVKHLPRAMELFKQYNTLTSYKHLLGIQSEIQTEIIILMKHWVESPDKSNIILIIENLDRCDEKKILPLIDALRIVLEDGEIAKRMKIIAAVDEVLLASCVEMKFKNFMSKKSSKEENDIFINEYLDKIFISGVKLNSLTPDDNGDMILALAKHDLKRNDLTVSQMKDILHQESSKEETDENKAEDVVISDENKSEIDPNGVGESTEKEHTHDTSQVENESNKEEKDEEIPELGFSVGEIKLIYNCAKKYVGLTPRKIRIIYYRYYLSKNLLFSLYDEARKNVWRNSEYSELLIELLFKFSINKKELDSIDVKKIMAIESNEELVRFWDTEIQIRKEDYLKLLNVLQMVIIF